MGRKRSKRKDHRADAAASGNGVERGALRADLLWALALSVLAAVQRVLFLHSNQDRDWPFTMFYEGDSETFYLFARAILRGELYDSGIPFHPPGFAVFLAGLHSLFGAGDGASQVPHELVRTCLAVLGGLTVGLLYLLVRPYLGRATALVAGLLASSHFGLYVLSVAPVSEGLYLFLLMAILLLWTRGLEHPLSAPGAAPPWKGKRPWITALAVGLLLGMLALTRAESVLLAAVLTGIGLIGWWRGSGDGRRDPRGLIPWALIAVGWMLAVAPWTLRNARNLRHANATMTLSEPLPTFVPLTLYGPLNLALANHGGADGSFSADLVASIGQSGALRFEDPEHLDLVLHGDRRAWRYVREHPVEWLGLVAKKWALVGQALRLGWTQRNLPGGLDGVRRPVDIFVPHASTAVWLTAPLLLLGLGICLRREGGPRRWSVLVLALAAPTFVATGLFFGYTRLGLLLVPFCLPWMAAALLRLGELGLRRGGDLLVDPPPRGLLVGLGLAAALVLAVEISSLDADRNFKATGTALPGSNKLNRDLPIELELLPPKP